MQLAQIFLNVPFEELDEAIIKAMQFVAEYCDADRAVIYDYDRDSATASHLYEWDVRPEYYTGCKLKTLRFSDMEAAHMLYLKGEAYLRSSLEELPAVSAHKRESENAGIEALCSYPIINNSVITGITAFSTACRKKEWAENEVALIELFSKIIMNILERKERETAFREYVYHSQKTAVTEARRIAVLETEAEMLRKNEAEYLEILDGSSEATWIKDLVHGTCRYSKQWSKRIGGSGIPTEEMNDFLISLIHPDDKDRTLREKNHICENKPSKYESQYRLKTADGSYIWVLDKGKITYDEQGAASRIYGTSTDITEQKRSEAIILRQNKILKTINMIYEKAMTCESMNDLGAACLDIIEIITESKASFIGEVGKDGILNAIAIREPGGGLFESDSPGHDSPFSHIKINILYNEVIQNGKSLLINDPSSFPDNMVNQEGGAEIISFLGVPFIRDNSVAGLLAAANRKDGFREDDKEMLEAVAPTVFEVLLRKFNEEAVKEREFLMRTIMDSSSDFLFLKDKDSRFVMVNQAYGRIFGVDTNDVIGKDAYDLYSDPQVANCFVEKDQHVIQTGETLIFEESVLTTDGYRTFLLSKAPWCDSNGGILGILGIAHDITELKKAEAALQETVASLKHSKDYINILYETTGKVLSSPTPRKEITALCMKVMEFLDCHVFFNYLVEEHQPALRLNSCGGVTNAQKQALDDLPLGSAVCGCAIRDGCRVITEHIQTTQDPRTEFIKTIGIRAYACHPLMADGKAIGGLAFGTRSRDLFSEEDLMLMKTVAESVAVAIRREQNEETLMKQAEELIIADNTKNEFLSALSHELRNPMATIQAGLSLLDIAEDKGQQNRAKQIMRRQMEYLSCLVDDLLDITRINRNKIVLRKESFDLNNTANAVADDMKALFSGRGVKLLSDIGPDSIYIHADPVRVKQAIGNLLHNAPKFSNNEGDVTLSVRTDNNCVFITVEDTGIGIEPAFLSTIFEPFTQMDKSIDRRNGGLGLGLYIVKGIAELHGGSVSAHSAGPGKGSVFTLRLPLHD